MADIINLRIVRKAHARATAEAQAVVNRVAFGRTKAEKRAEADELARRDRLLDGARLDEVD